MNEIRLNRVGALVTAISLAYLVSKVFLGIDFTDEMQHYGELVSLVSTGKLFQVDLFLQQAMYVFLYPVFRAFYLIQGGWDHLILFGRLFMVAAYAAAAWLAYRRLASGTSRYPGWAAASIVLTWLPFNILSPYYNAAAALLISLIAYLWTGAARGRGYLMTSVLAASMLCVVYPTLGLAVGVLLVMDEVLAKRYRLATQMVGLLAVFGGLWGVILWGMTDSLKDIEDALAFSKAFGVGYAFSHPKHLLNLLAVVLTGLVFIRLGVRQETAERSLNGRIALPVAVLAFVWLAWLANWLLVSLLYLAVLFLVRYLPVASPEKRQLARLGVFGLLIGGVSALTSGNGVINIAIGVGAVLPYLAGLLLKAGAVPGRKARVAPSGWQATHVVLFFGLLVAANNVLHPYREEPVWRLGHSLDRVPAFRGLTGSDEKSTAVDVLQGMVGSPEHLQDRRLLVIGPQPWVYFALQSEPLTPMLFMHFSGGIVANRIVADRMARLQRPDFILVMSEPPPEIMAALSSMVRLGYRCEALASQLPAAAMGAAMEKFGFGPEVKLCRLGA
jgi:hypothetical protein